MTTLPTRLWLMSLYSSVKKYLPPFLSPLLREKNCPLNVITGCDTIGRSKVCVISGNKSNFALEERKPNQEGGNICSQYCIKSVHAIKYCIVCKSAKKIKEIKNSIYESIPGTLYIWSTVSQDVSLEKLFTFSTLKKINSFLPHSLLSSILVTVN